ncbi:hypothetical protein OEA41_000534 [Lepraria neglecta]|uniref:Uncharacterized protein n=1 Tax=Lepraria neglecta TaxID=209136 RepID=A0AAD9ZGE3_9LECA|nr:hypothetical protein OEA41_000534 [Lepraria neglecta]
MPPSSQPDDSSQNPLHTNDEELEELLAAPPIDSARPLLGIPQENDDYFANFALSYDPSTGQQTYEDPSEDEFPHDPQSSIEHTLPPPWGRSQAELDVPRSTAPEISLNQSQASAGTFNPSQATQTSEPTLGNRQNSSARYIHALPQGSETDSVTPGSSPYSSACFDVLEDMNLVQDQQYSSEKGARGYPTRVPSPWNVSDREDLELQSAQDSRKPRETKAIDTDDMSSRSRRATKDANVASSSPATKRKPEPLSEARRAKVAKIRKLRASAITFSNIVPKIKKWVDKSNRTVQLYNIGLTDRLLEPSKRPMFTVICRRYTDEFPAQYLKKSWLSNGQKVDLPLPQYAISSLQRTKVSDKLDTLLDTNYDMLQDELGFGQDEIVSSSLTEAARCARGESNCKNRIMMRSAMKIAIITRLISKSFNITGSESLGISQVMDTTSPYYQRVPIPPILDFQIDWLCMRKMNELRRTLVSQLKDLIMKRERSNWYTIFLTIIVLLSNLEFIYQHQHRQMERYGRPDFNSSTMMESWQHSAKILITYFHAISHGNIPILMEWTKEDEEKAELDEQARAYLVRLKDLVTSQDDMLRERAKGHPYTPLVWISTLLLKSDQDNAPSRDSELLGG